MNENQRVFRVPQCWQNTSRIHPRLRPYLNEKTGKLAPFSSIGCYPIYYVARRPNCRHRYEVLCAECASTMAEFSEDENAKVTDADINWEDEDLHCECGKKIESAYEE